MPTVCVIQHIEVETPGLIAKALTAAGCQIKTILSHTGQPVPKNMTGLDGLVVMGGPPSVYEQDKFPYLRDELRLIESALAANKPILGVCLGSQLLAAALGARVYPGRQKEIGWYPVTLTDDARQDVLLGELPDQFTPLHWHGDIFDLPKDAVALASSALTPLQAYRYGANAYGFLCHLEVTDRHVADWVTLFADEMHRAGTDARAILAGAKKHLPPLQKLGAAVFARWAGTLGSNLP